MTWSSWECRCGGGGSSGGSTGGGGGGESREEEEVVLMTMGGVAWCDGCRIRQECLCLEELREALHHHLGR